MKQYTFSVECRRENQTKHPISDGHSFVFKTTNQFKSGQREIFFQIMLGNDYYRVNVDLLRSKTYIFSPKHYRVLKQPALPSVENIVIRIIKGMGSQTISGTYSNGLFIDTPWTFPSTCVDNIGTWGDYKGQPSSCPEVSLTVFDEAESRNAADFAQAILLNPDASPLQIKAEERDEVDRERVVETCVDNMGAWGDYTILLNPDVSPLDIKEEMGKVDRERAVEEKAKELKQREKAVVDREQALEARERAVEQREKDISQVEDRELERRETKLHGDGADRPPHPLPDVHPPDADWMKLSATIAWPRAANHVLRRPSLITLQTRHDSLMCEWVVARGDNISSNAYDYFVYSHGVVWTKVILEDTASEAKLANIRERHKAIMELLV